MKISFTLIATIALISLPVQARPVSYPGGWTVMMQNDGDHHSIHTHYSPTSHYSIGLRNEYDRKDDFQNHSLQLNTLAKRWNNHDSQGNFYLKSGIGYAIAKENTEQSHSAFTGVALDWENRRFFTSYENRYDHAGSVSTSFKQSARLGIAPYIGEFGDIHTWVMMQFDHNPKSTDGDQFTITPLIRLFYDTHLMETGLSDENDIMFNYIKRF